MKAQEVLRRYAAGERNFRRADLRGRSLQGQDLSPLTLQQRQGYNFG